MIAISVVILDAHNPAALARHVAFQGVHPTIDRREPVVKAATRSSHPDCAGIWSLKDCPQQSRNGYCQRVAWPEVYCHEDAPDDARVALLSTRFITAS